MLAVNRRIDYEIVHEIPGRLRVKLTGLIPDKDAIAFETLLLEEIHVSACTVYQLTGCIALTYTGTRKQAIETLDALTLDRIIKARPSDENLLAVREVPLWKGITDMVIKRILIRLFLPAPLRMVYRLWQFRLFLTDGLRSLRQGKLDVPVLDAAAVGSSFLKGEFDTAGSQMFLLNLGEYLEENTRARSRHDLINTLLDVPEKTWRVEGKEEYLVDTLDLKKGDIVVVRAGSPISIDGVVKSGHALVNQVTLTGEPEAIERQEADDVYAGTTIEAGELYIQVRSLATETRVRAIVQLVEQAELHKPENQKRLERLADRLVPWNFLYAACLLLATRSFTRAATALMVDYSCALKLVGSITSLAALREATMKGFTVKGANSLEEFAQADTIVFDKTGTLTLAEPKVRDIVALDSWNKKEILRLAACLEEHFPHSVARAVVKAAADQGLNHRERHAAVEYVVAHGIASTLEGKRVIIGSGHFVLEDEGVPISEAAKQKIASKVGDFSPLYLAVDHELVGVICIEDPLKPGVAEDLKALRRAGFKRLVMLTGDNISAARSIALEAGITEFKADLLPEDKHEFIQELVAKGHKVAMVGDGINDAPALSSASVGIAMGDGAAIAAEVSDIALADGNLSSLITLRQLSEGMVKRMRNTSNLSLGINTLLLALGSTGVITAQTSSVIHNATTVALSMYDMNPLIKPAKPS